MPTVRGAGEVLATPNEWRRNESGPGASVENVFCCAAGDHEKNEAGETAPSLAEVENPSDGAVVVTGSS